MKFIVYLLITCCVLWGVEPVLDHNVCRSQAGMRGPVYPPNEPMDDDVHRMMGFSDSNLLTLAIDNAIRRGSKFFNILNIGSITWGYCMADYLNAKYEGMDIQFVLTGVIKQSGTNMVRGIIKGYSVLFLQSFMGKCNVASFAEFPIENTKEMLSHVQYHFIISRGIFEGTVNTVDVCRQCYNLLMPQGFFSNS